MGAITAVSALVSLLSFIAGLWGATYLQDREIRRRHLGIVRALLAEVRRVYTEVGAKNPAYIAISLSGKKASVPTLAPWVQQLATDLASTNSAFLSRFMDFERYLINLGSAESSKDAAIAYLASRKEGVAILKGHNDFMGLLHAEADMKKAENSAELALFEVDTDFKYIKRALDDLEQQLTSDERMLAAGLRTHLPWK